MDVASKLNADGLMEEGRLMKIDSRLSGSKRDNENEEDHEGHHSADEEKVGSD